MKLQIKRVRRLSDGHLMGINETDFDSSLYTESLAPLEEIIEVDKDGAVHGAESQDEVSGASPVEEPESEEETSLGNLSIREIKEGLADVSSLEKLDELKAEEAGDRDRKGVLLAIEARREELED